MTEETRDTWMAYFEGHEMKSVIRKTSIPIYKLFTRINCKRQTKKAENFVLFLSACTVHSIMRNFEPRRFSFKKIVSVVSLMKYQTVTSSSPFQIRYI